MSKFILVLLVSVFYVNSSYANNWELSGSSNFNISFDSDGNFDDKRENSTYFNLGTRLGYRATALIELTSSFSFRNVSGYRESLQIAPLVGLTLNMNDDFMNSFYITGLVGPMFRRTASDRNYTVFSYFVGFGKRIEIVDNVSWMPEISYSGHTSGTVSTNNGEWTLNDFRTLDITPFQISVAL